MIPALMIPLFFFVVNVGALQDFSEQGIPGFDYKAFQLPVAIIFAVTGISRAGTLVLDIQDGYFDRLAHDAGEAAGAAARADDRRLRARVRPVRPGDGARVRPRRALRDRACSACSPSSCSPGSGASCSPASPTRSPSRPAAPARSRRASSCSSRSRSSPPRRCPAKRSRGGSTRWPATTPSPTCSTACAR